MKRKKRSTCTSRPLITQKFDLHGEDVANPLHTGHKIILQEPPLLQRNRRINSILWPNRGCGEMRNDDEDDDYDDDDHRTGFE